MPCLPPASNLLTETNDVGNEMQYGWNSAGQLVKVTYPDSNSVTYTYNALGQMATAADWLSHTTDFAYDSAGNLQTVTFPNNRTEAYSYNSAEQLDKIATTNTSTHAAQFTFDASATGGLDSSGDVQSMNTTQATGYGLTPGSSSVTGSDLYTYDQNSRMLADTQTAVGADRTTTTDQYQNNGEIHQQVNAVTVSGTTTTNTLGYSYSPDGSDPAEVTKITDNGTTDYASYTYNKEGDRTACSATGSGYMPCDGQTGTTYTFDGNNRLVTATIGSGVSENLTYDGNDLLLKQLETITGVCPTQPPPVQRHPRRRLAAPIGKDAMDHAVQLVGEDGAHVPAAATAAAPACCSPAARPISARSCQRNDLGIRVMTVRAFLLDHAP